MAARKQLTTLPVTNDDTYAAIKETPNPHPIIDLVTSYHKQSRITGLTPCSTSDAARVGLPFTSRPFRSIRSMESTLHHELVEIGNALQRLSKEQGSGIGHLYPSTATH